MSRKFWIFVAVIAVAVGLRAGAAVWWQSRLQPNQKFVFGDSESYWELGQAIAAGRPYQFRNDERQVFRSPGYPAILAGVFAIFGQQAPVLYARMLGVALGGAAVAGVGWLAAQVFDTRTGLVAAMLAAVYPGAIGMSVFILAEAVFCPLMLAHLNLWLLALRQKHLLSMIAVGLSAGFCYGAATLVRPSWMLMVPFAVVVGTVPWLIRWRADLFSSNKADVPNSSGKRPPHLLVCGCMLLGLCLSMAPWWVRNYQVTGRFVATTLFGGASLYDGLNRRADGGSDMRFMKEFHAAQKAADQVADQPLQGTFETRLDDRLHDAAVDWAWQNPIAVLGLAGNKFLRMWNVIPNYVEFQTPLMRFVVFAGFTPLFIAAMIGLAAFAQRGWPIAICYLPAVYFTCLHMVFVSSVRYRQPPMLPLIAVAAGGLVYVIWPKLTGAKPRLPWSTDSVPSRS